MLKTICSLLAITVFLLTSEVAHAQAGKVVAEFAKEVLKELAKSVLVDVLKDTIKPSTSKTPQVIPATNEDTSRTLNILRELTNTASPLEERIGLYATNVDYFNAGVVNHEFILRERRRFESRWPIRRYTIKSIDEIAIAPDRTYVVARYAVEFYVAREGDSRSGTSNVAVVIGSFNSQPRIHAIKEWVNHDHK